MIYSQNTKAGKENEQKGYLIGVVRVYCFGYNTWSFRIYHTSRTVFVNVCGYIFHAEIDNG